MTGSQLPGFARRMQRIRKQQEPLGEVRIFRCQHTGLAAAIGNSTEPHSIGVLLANLQDFLAQSFAIPRGVARARWALGPRLPKSQIITHYFNLMFGKRFGEGNEQRRVAIRSSAVRE